MIRIICEIALCLSSLVVILIGGYAGRLQAVTLWVGKKIAPDGMETLAPTGLQDAITPKFQNFFNMVLPICYLAIVISGSIIKWYIGIVALLVSIILMGLVQRFYSNKICHYLQLLIHYMDNQLADYERDNDKMRAEAAKEVSDKLHNLFLDIHNLNPDIPDFEEIKKMPLGGSV